MQNNASLSDLLRRIEVLERRLSALESRSVGSDDRTPKPLPIEPPAPPSAAWMDISNWRQLRRGDTKDKVRRLLGEPRRIECDYCSETWSYDKRSVLSPAQVEFREDKVFQWREPK